MDAIEMAKKTVEAYKILEEGGLPRDAAASYAFSLVMEADSRVKGFEDLFKQEKHLDGHGG